MRPKKILHPTDSAESSRPALEQALALAREYDARLVLRHVVDSLGPEDLSYGESVSADQPEAYRRACSSSSTTSSPRNPTSGPITCSARRTW